MVNYFYGQWAQRRGPHIKLVQSDSALVLLSLSRVQNLTSSTNPRTPCPAESTSLWPLMTLCLCPQRPTHHIYPVLTSPLNCQGSRSLLGCYVAASASPPSLSTWRPPQRCRRSRGTSPIPCYQAARTPNTTNTQKPGPWDRTTKCPPDCYFFPPHLKSPLSCSDAAE